MRSFQFTWFCRLLIIIIMILQYVLVVRPFFDFGIDSYAIEEIRNGDVAASPYLGNIHFVVAFFIVAVEPWMSMFFALLLFLQVIVSRADEVMKKENVLSILVLVIYVIYIYFYFSPTGLATQLWIFD